MEFINKKIELKLKQYNKIINSYNKRMIIPVKCFNCGKVLANKWKYYNEKVREKKLSKGIEDTSKVTYLTKEFVDKTIEGEVLDELGLKRMCCRTKMLTHVDIV